jgi:hypothetical protein
MELVGMNIHHRWHTSGSPPQRSDCTIIRANRGWIIPNRNTWNINERVWMAASSVNIFSRVEKFQILSLLESKEADIHYRYRKKGIITTPAAIMRITNANIDFGWCDVGDRNLIEGCLLSRSPSIYHTLQLLLRHGATFPYHNSHNSSNSNSKSERSNTNKIPTASTVSRHCSLVTTALVDGDARLARTILHMPKGTWYDDAGPIVAQQDSLKWSDVTLFASSSSEYNPLHLSGFGRTVGVDENQTQWPIITSDDLRCVGRSDSAMYAIPWMVWAYGMDPNVVPMISTMNQHYLTLPAEIITECPYAINEIVDLLDPSDYNPHCKYSASTGDPIHEPLYINKDCKWIGARVVDIAYVRIPYQYDNSTSANSCHHHICVRVSPISYSPMFDGMYVGAVFCCRCCSFF